LGIAFQMLLRPQLVQILAFLWRYFVTTDAKDCYFALVKRGSALL
jgi:hypothetical protein